MSTEHRASLFVRFRHLDAGRDALLLTLVWVAVSVHDQIWLAVHQGVPDWDQGKYLTAALTCWRALQDPSWWSDRWWTEFWQLAPKTPPLAAIATAPLFEWFGPGYRQAMGLQTVCSALTIVATYRLGVLLFTREVARSAAILTVVVPSLGQARLRYTLDYPLVAAVTVALLAIAAWARSARPAPRRRSGQAVAPYRCTNGPRALVSDPRPQSWDRDTRGSRLQPAPRRSWLKPASTTDPGPRSPVPVSRWRQFALAAAAGLLTGAALLVKQQAIYVLTLPLLWPALVAIRRRHWLGLVQWACAIALAGAVVWPWFRASWVLILSGGWRATAIAASTNQQAPWLSMEGWTVYLRAWPYLVSWPVIMSVIVAALAWRIAAGRDHTQRSGVGPEQSPDRRGAWWLAGVVSASIVVASLSPNRLERYLLSAVPPALLLASWMWFRAGVAWARRLRWGTIATVAAAALLNQWPIGGAVGARAGAWLAPDADRRAVRGVRWPHREVIDHVVARDPWVVSTIGVTASSPTVNPENIDFYGQVRGFQVYGREAGASAGRVSRDARAFTWYVSARGPGQENPRDSRRRLADAIGRREDVALDRTWELPGGGALDLYRRRLPAVGVEIVDASRRHDSRHGPDVVLASVHLPASIRPGSLLPVTYVWEGPSDSLRHGLVLLSWHPIDGRPDAAPAWIHDHAIGFGSLHLDAVSDRTRAFAVMERTATKVPAGTPPGRYRLSAEYLDRRSPDAGASPVAMPEVAVTVDGDSPDLDAPELDLVTQLRELAEGLKLGPRGIRLLFDEIGRIDQYDPVQDFFEQAALASAWRLRGRPDDLPSAYTLLLARTLQRQVDEARDAAALVAALDARNPYPHAYTALLELYDLNPVAAEAALDRAAALGARDPEVHALRGAAALMRGRLIRAFAEARTAFAVER